MTENEFAARIEGNKIVAGIIHGYQRQLAEAQAEGARREQEIAALRKWLRDVLRVGNHDIDTVVARLLAPEEWADANLILAEFVHRQTDIEAAWEAARKAEAELAAMMDRVAQMRAALFGLIGADGADELRMMEVAIRMTAAPAADKAAMLNAIHVLLAEATP